MMKRTTRWMLALLLGSAVAYAKGETTATEATVEEASPVSTTADGLVSVVASNMPLSRVVSQLDDATSAKVVARGRAAHEKVPLLVVRNVPLKEALVELTSSLNDMIIYEPAGKPNHYEIWDQATFKAEVLPTLAREKIFIPKHITAEEAAKAIDGVKTPKIGKVAFDPRSNKVFVTDLPPVFELMQRLIEHIDVAWTSRVFQIKHADVEDLAEKLETVRSPAAPDPITDRRTRQIIVQDRQEKIAEMEKLVEVLDSGGQGNGQEVQTRPRSDPFAPRL